MRALVAPAALLLALACGEPDPITLPDATLDSGRHPDAETPDSGDEVEDVGFWDAGFPDMGTPDSGDESMDAEPVDMGPVDAGYACDNLPEVVVTESLGGTAYKDVAFDADGNLVGSDSGSLWKSRTDGTRTLWVPNRSAYGGHRYLPNGDFVVADEGQGALVRVLPNGAQEIIASGLGQAYGLAIDLRGRIWVANHEAVIRVDPVTQTSSVVLRGGEVPSPRSITFDATYETLFVGSTSSTTIWAVPLDADGNPIFPQIWGSLPAGAGWVDGLGMDECGNLYAADYLSQSLYRIPPNGVGTLLVAWPSGKYGHGLEFGSGLGGWDEFSIYLPQPYDNSTVGQVWIGVRGKPRPYP